MLARLAHFVARHRIAVIGIWVVLTLIGGVAAGKVSKRWYQSFSIPGKSAYEANQRTLKTFGTGVRPPNVVVFHSSGDVTKSAAVRQAMQRAAETLPGARTSSYFSTGNLMYVSRDRHTTFEEVYPPGPAKFDTKSRAERMRAAAATGLPAGSYVVFGARLRKAACPDTPVEIKGGRRVTLVFESAALGGGAPVCAVRVSAGP